MKRVHGDMGNIEKDSSRWLTRARYLGIFLGDQLIKQDKTVFPR